MPHRNPSAVHRLLPRCLFAAALSIAAAPLAAATSGSRPAAAAKQQPSGQRPAERAHAAGQPATTAERPAPSPAELAALAEQLGSEQYVQREISSLRLAEAGAAAVPALEAAVQRGDLETTERALQVLQRIAVDQAPDQPGRAWEALSRIAGLAPGSASARAAAALRAISQQREQTARERLAAVGIQIGLIDEIPEALQESAEVCHIPGDWDGPPDALVWLQWLYGVRYALLDGPAADAQVLQQVAKMPDLQNAVLRKARIEPQDLRHLADLQRLDLLELRYIAIGDDDLQQISQLPLRSTLTLNGTRISDQGVQRLRQQLPGLRIVYKKGGFLGVTSSSGVVGVCQITAVVAGGAAEAAGLRANDVITRVDDVPIQSFTDLQDVINERPPGETLTVVYERGGTQHATQLTLGQQPIDVQVVPPR